MTASAVIDFGWEILWVGMTREWRDGDTLRELYHGQGLSLSEVADELGCSAQTVKNNMDRLDIPTRSQQQAQLSDEMPIHLSETGHEYVAHTYDSEQVNVYVHRLAAVAWFGLDAVVDRHVHHQNEIPWDTREDNVEMKTPEGHGKTHQEKGPWRDEERLRAAYERNDGVKEATAEELGCSHETVRRYVREFGIEAV